MNSKLVIGLALCLAPCAATSLYSDEPVQLEKDATVISKAALRSSLDLGLEAHTELERVSGPHPLEPSLRIARAGFQRVQQQVRDYTCLLVRRERVDGQLRGPETIFAKVRHPQMRDGPRTTPFSLYLRFLEPEKVRGREVLFVEGRDDNKLLVRRGGRRLAFITLLLEPTSMLAMNGNRYPVTEFGILRLIERMILLGQKELGYDECQVDIREGVDLEGRLCQCVEVIHPVRRPHFEYHIARIYIDEQLMVPVRFESYDWPSEESDAPPLKEEYTYQDLKLNVGLTDLDFDRHNPEYGFR